MNGVRIPKIPDGSGIAGLTIGLAAIAVGLAIQVYRGGMRRIAVRAEKRRKS